MPVKQSFNTPSLIGQLFLNSSRCLTSRGFIPGQRRIHMPPDVLGNTALVLPQRDSWKPRRLEILDTPVDLVTPSMALAAVQHMIKEPGGHCIFAVNPEKVIRSQSDSSLRALLARADLLIPDGIGIVLGLRILHGIKITRVPGIDLFMAICGLACQTGYRVYLLGAEPDMN